MAGRQRESGTLPRAADIRQSRRRRDGKNGNKTTLRRKTAGGAGGYEPGKIAADESKALGRQAWLEYMARLQKAGCRQMDTTDKGLMGFDGSQWIPGVNPNGQYLVIDRWRGCGIRELCLPLFRLT